MDTAFLGHHSTHYTKVERMGASGWVQRQLFNLQKEVSWKFAQFSIITSKLHILVNWSLTSSVWCLLGSSCSMAGGPCPGDQGRLWVILTSSQFLGMETRTKVQFCEHGLWKKFGTNDLTRRSRYEDETLCFINSRVDKLVTTGSLSVSQA